MPAAELTLKNLRWDHEAIMDYMIANPEKTQNEIAANFRYTPSRFSIIINSPAFKEKFAERKAILSDPLIQASIEERLETVARRSLDKLLERLDNNTPISNGDLIRAAQLGVGDRNQTKNTTNVQQSLYVVALPSPAPNAQEWRQSVQGAPMVIENVEKSS